jgi:hypothetical protein
VQGKFLERTPINILLKTTVLPTAGYKLIGVVTGRASFKTKLAGFNDVLHFNDPSAVAVASLSTAVPYGGPLLYSFLEAGGLDALVRLLKESSCPLALGYTLHLIRQLMTGGSPSPVAPDWGQEVAHKFSHLGGWDHLAT